MSVRRLVPERILGGLAKVLGVPEILPGESERRLKECHKELRGSW